MTDRQASWAKVIGVILPLAIVGLVALIRMTSRVDNLEAEVKAKASQDVVNIQYQTILQRLDRIEQKVDAK